MIWFWLSMGDQRSGFGNDIEIILFSLYVGYMVLDFDVDLFIDNCIVIICLFLNVVVNGICGEWLIDFYGRKICSYICGIRE